MIPQASQPQAATMDADRHGTPWFCAYTKPCQEEYAVLHLQRQGIETCLPKIKRRRVVKGVVRWTVGPMFPRYVFVRSGDASLQARIRSTRGVVRLVSFGGRPGVVPEELIEALRQRCPDEVLEVDRTDFQAGEKVRIIAGPCAGMEAIFERSTTQRERVVILLKIMASVARLQVERQMLARSDDVD